MSAEDDSASRCTSAGFGVIIQAQRRASFMTFISCAAIAFDASWSIGACRRCATFPAMRCRYASHAALLQPLTPYLQVRLRGIEIRRDYEIRGDYFAACRQSPLECSVFCVPSPAAGRAEWRFCGVVRHYHIAAKMSAAARPASAFQRSRAQPVASGRAGSKGGLSGRPWAHCFMPSAPFIAVRRLFIVRSRALTISIFSCKATAASSHFKTESFHRQMKAEMAYGADKSTILVLYSISRGHFAIKYASQRRFAIVCAK